MQTYTGYRSAFLPYKLQPSALESSLKTGTGARPPPTEHPAARPPPPGDAGQPRRGRHETTRGSPYLPRACHQARKIKEEEEGPHLRSREVQGQSLLLLLNGTPTG